MSVVDVYEDWKSRVSREFFGNSAQRRFTVKMDSASSDNETQALEAGEIPFYGEPHPDEPFLRVSSITAESIGPAYVQVIVQYQGHEGQDAGSVNDPLAMPADMAWEEAVSVEPIDQTMNQEPIVNTAGQPYDPPITREFVDPVLVITRNEGSFSWSNIENYRMTTNLETFAGAGEGQALMRSIRSRRIAQAGFEYWRTTYRIQFRTAVAGGPGPEVAWHRKILNAGRMERRAGATKLTHIKDPNTGETVVDPWPLDDQGVALADPKEGNIIWNFFEIYGQSDFSALGLPTP